MTPPLVLAAGFDGADAGILIAVVVLLMIAAVLALAETGLVRTSKSRARSLEEQGRHGARSLNRLAQDPERFLAPVLLLVLICQLVAATLVGVMASHLFGAIGVVIATVFEVIVIFVGAEAIPKHWAVRHADRAALLAAPIVSALMSFPPIRLISGALIGLSRIVMPGDDGEEAESEVTEYEFLALADEAVEAEVLEREERALLSSIIEFGDTIVREVMAPRTDIVAVAASDSIGTVIERAIESGLSRIPVYEKNVDDITGIAYSRDLIAAVRDERADKAVREVCRGAHYVPETMRVAPLLREMQRDQYHLAVVIDEYGGTAGLVTLEDLIEELVGEISDEFDVDEPLVEPLSDREYRVLATMPVDEVNDLLGTDFPIGDWHTIGGLVFHLCGEVPTEGEVVSYKDVELVAERVQKRRIGSVRIVKPEPAPGSTSHHGHGS